MEAGFRRFFTNSIARGAGFAGLLCVLIVAGEFGYKALTSEQGVAWFGLFSIRSAVILLLLAVVIEYLSRIANAMEQAAGVEHDPECWW